jgi:Dynamin family
VRTADLEVSAPWLEAGLVLVDTPGTGSIYVHNTDVALGFLPQADAALFVLSADPPLSEAEREDLAALRRAVPLVICVLNKIDQVEPGERDAVLRFAREQLQTAGYAELPMVPVSARDALDAAQREDAVEMAASGITGLRELIEDRVAGRRHALAAAGARRRALHALAAAEAKLRLQQRVADLGAAESAARLARFRPGRRCASGSSRGSRPVPTRPRLPSTAASTPWCRGTEHQLAGTSSAGSRARSSGRWAGG